MQAPFCVHPKTGKVCVPIDPQRSSAFDPDAVPKIDTISQELEALGKARSYVCALYSSHLRPALSSCGVLWHSQSACTLVALICVHWRHDVQGGGIPPSMRPHLEFFETAFLAPLEQASAAAVLRASRERQASSMEW